MSWILSLGAGKGQLPLLRAIRHEGHKVAAIDNQENPAGLDLCDAFRCIPNEDAQGIVDWAKWVGIEAVMCAGQEVPDLQALIAQALDLPCFSVLTGAMCRQKLLYKETLRSVGIPVTVPYIVFDGAAKAIFDKLQYKVVVKPQRGSGARGVTYVDNPMELPMALRDAETVGHDVIMERYQPGPQISSESLIWNGQAITLGFVDRFYPLGRPNFKEIGGSMPSAWESQREAANDLVRRAARALGIWRGTLKCDLVLTKRGPMIIELTPRISGGPLTSIIKDSMGVDFLRAAVRIYMGDVPEATTPSRDCQVARAMDGSDMDWNDSRKYIVPELGE